MKWNSAKVSASFCLGMEQCQTKAQRTRRVAGEQLSRKGHESAGGSRLNMSQQCALAAEKANHFLECTKHSPGSQSKEMLWPHLECCMWLCAPQHKNDVKILEFFQRGSTKPIKGLDGIAWEDSCCLIWRRPRGNLSALCSSLKKGSRGGAGLCSWELMAESKWHKALPGRVRLGVRKPFCIVRLVQHWNKLPREMVDVPWLQTFSNNAFSSVL